MVIVGMVCWAAVAWANGTHDHANHDPGLCHELSIGLGNGQDGSLSSPPIMRLGKFPVVVNFYTRGYGVVCGNGLRIFVDFALAHKNDEVHADQYTFDLDLSALSEGLHYILVNTCDHNDHMGIASVVIQVRKCMLPGVGQGKKVGVPVPPGSGVSRGLSRARGQAVPPAFDTDLQPAALACCGDYGDWPVAADCQVMVEVPEEAPANDSPPSDF